MRILILSISKGLIFIDFIYFYTIGWQTRLSSEVSIDSEDAVLLSLLDICLLILTDTLLEEIGLASQ